MLRYRYSACATVAAAVSLSLSIGCSPDQPGQSNPSAFVERWESIPWTTRTPGGLDTFRGDAGNWFLGDTVSNFDHCGPSPHLAEVIMHRGSKAIRLTSNESPCVDNLWIQFINESVVNNALNIPISPSTQLSFFEEGVLHEPGSSSQCGLSPCEILLEVEDTRGNLLVYILQSSTGRDRSDTFYSLEIVLDPDAGHYQRNLYDDFSRIARFDPSDAKVRAVTLSIDSHGWTIMDDLVIADNPGIIE